MSFFRSAGLVLLGLWGAAWVGAVDLPDGFINQRIADLEGTGPADFEFLPDGRILTAVQRTPEIRIWREGFGGASLIGTIPGVSTAGPEEGLVGLAVDPDWPEFPYLYVHFTATDSTTRVRRYTATGALSDPAGLFSISDPYDILVVPNLNVRHQGGTLEFDLDNMLLVSLGDDSDPCAAQDSTSLFGVICRLDVLSLPPGAGGPPPRADLIPAGNPFSGGGGDEELVYCFGFRNPFRFCVHPDTGSLLIGDVGQVGYEEINQAWGGENFGWPFREGSDVRTVAGCTEPGGSGSQSYELYEYAYPTDPPGAVIGGVVYKPQGGAFDFPSEYDGAYFFSDYIKGFVRVLEQGGGAWAPMDSVPGQPDSTNWGTLPSFISDWEQGPDGALYYLLQYKGQYQGSAGELHRIVYPSGAIGTRDPEPRARLRAWPNPARAGAGIHGYAPAGVGSVHIYNVMGARIRTLNVDASSGHFTWNGRDRRGLRVPPGVYWVKPRGASLEQGTKITLLP